MKSTAGASHTEEEEKSRSLRPERGGVQTLKDPEKKETHQRGLKRLGVLVRLGGVWVHCVCVFFVHARLYPGFSPRF